MTARRIGHPFLIVVSVLVLGACSSSKTQSHADNSPSGNSLPVEESKSDSATNSDSVVKIGEYADKVPDFCAEMNRQITKYNWGLKTCDGIKWKSERLSVDGRPLIYAEFGDASSKNTTLILSMVHPDEVTPLYLGFKIAQYVKEHESELKDSHIIIAPFVNPDGFYKKPPTRMNARGVDVNRNFDTPLWREKALASWNTTLKKNPRRFPGNSPSSEPETKFQENLITRFDPTKILSVHAPLNVTDYDGPSSLTLDRFPKEYVHACYMLRARLRAKSTGFFPGSLGNYAGVEKGIPTITLELPSANPKMADAYWKKFQPGINSMIQFKIDAEVAAAKAKKKIR